MENVRVCKGPKMFIQRLYGTAILPSTTSTGEFSTCPLVPKMILDTKAVFGTFWENWDPFSSPYTKLNGFKVGAFVFMFDFYSVLTAFQVTDEQKTAFRALRVHTEFGAYTEVHDKIVEL